MRAIALLYHDVVESDFDASGFPGHAAGTYKLDARVFEDHVRRIARVAPNPPVGAQELCGEETRELPLLLTFDDGGISAHTHVARLFDTLGWIGHFFITTNHIGTPAFLSGEQIRALRRAGHVIGSHSASHPMRMAACSRPALVQEWRSSRSALSDCLGEDVTVASVPGGYFARHVAEAASEAGIRVLFTSEPTTRCHAVEDCLVVGRFAFRTGTSSATAERLARAHWSPRVKTWLSWNSRKMAKAVNAELYLRLRDAILPP